MSVLDVGDSGHPVVLLCHGFPECMYSWRHQVEPLVEAGYRVIVPDQRGYGASDAPEDVAAYDIFHLVGDLVGLLDAKSVEAATIVGHDWGSMVAWHAAQFRPDRFHRVMGVSVPHTPRMPIAPTELFEMAFKDRFFYMLYFQEPGVADAELGADVRETMRRTLCAGAGETDLVAATARAAGLPRDAGWFRMLGDVPDALPGWLSDADLDEFTRSFERSGFTGPLNWYRNLDRNWELTAPWQGARIDVPASFVYGTADAVVVPLGGVIETLAERVPGLVSTVAIEGAGHWTQQEKPAEFTAALLEFLAAVDA